MRRILLLLVATLALPWLGACARRTGSTNVEELDFGSLSANGGGLLAFAAAPTTFERDVAFAGEWLQDGTTIAAGRWVAAGDQQLVTLVPPTLPAGSYEVAIELGDVRGIAVVQVTAAAAVADPSAAVQAFAADVVASLAALRVDAQALHDTALAAALIADFDRLEVLRSTFQGSLATASPAELQLLAMLLAATPTLTSSLDVERGGNGVAANVDSASALVPDVTANWVQGSKLLAFGLVAGDDLDWTNAGPVVGDGLVVAGALQMLLGLGGVASALDLPLTAVASSELQLSRGSSANPGDDEVVISAVLPGSAAADLRLTVGLSFPLRATGSFATLCAADRARQDSRFASIFAAMDAAALLLPELAPAVLAVVQTPYPEVPAQPRLATGTVLGQALVLESQSNSQVVLTLANGQLTAVLQGAASPATTTATFTFDGGTLGQLAATVTVDVLELPASLALIAPGSFAMGSNDGVLQESWVTCELPVHTVAITEPFWMGKHEVTQAQYQALMGSNPSTFVGANLPVDSVSWTGAVAYCDALSVQEAAAGRLPDGYEYRLPTEAEWEYCCRAGTTTEWNVGSSGLACSQANHFSLSSGYCVPDAGFGGRSCAVGSYAANAFGLFDLHGNVNEWCLDGWNGDDNYPSGAVSDPYVATGTFRIYRGGSWLYDPFYCRSAYRNADVPGNGINDVGFRVVCAPVR